MTRRTIYLPIETKCRDLLGRTLLAAKAVERGWRAVIGGIEMHDHMAEDWPPGLLIENNIPDTKAARLDRLRRRGFRIVDLCEEGSMYDDAAMFWSYKIGPRSLEAVDLILTGGARGREDIRAHRPAAADKLVLTGNPRFDTLLPRVRDVYAAAARTYRARYGRFLIVNSNFSAANPYTARDVVARLQFEGKLSTKAQVDWKRRQVAYKQRHLTRLQTALVEVARAGVFDRVVVRPHPTENHDMWRRWAAGRDIEVQHEGSAISWMLAADLVLHPGCTTAFEALLLDRPAASFAPEPDSEFLNPADALSIPVADAGAVIALARARDRAAAASRTAARAALKEYIDNVAPPLAADRVLDVVDRIDVPRTGTARYAFRRVCRSMNVLSRRSWRQQRLKTRSTYRLQKFPGLRPEDVRDPVACWIEAGVLRRMPAITRVGSTLLQLQ